MSLSNSVVEDQLANLVEKLKGKSTYTNLKKIVEGKCKNKIQETKGISSLLTHALIEMEVDSNYNILVANLYERLGKLIYGLN